MRLIDADELKIDYGFTYSDITPTHEEMYALIDRQKTVESLRCRDCKWWDKEYRECHSPNWDTGTDEHFITPPGFFCGWVERREHGTD